MSHFVKPLVATFFHLLTLNAWAAGTIQVVAVNEGEGRDDGESYTAFTDPVLNEKGQVAFLGFRLVGDFGDPDEAGGIYTGDGRGPLAKLIGVGDPGFAPESFVSFLRVGGINNKGQIAYELEVASTTGDFLGTGVFLDAVDSTPSKLVVSGDLDPDGDVIGGIRFTDLDSEGRIGLRFGHPAGGDSNAFRSTAVFESGTVRVLAKEDQLAPDGVGVVKGAFFPSLNDAGQTHYSPRIDRPGLEERPALFRDTPGIGRELLFRSEDPDSAPSFDGTLLLESYTPSMNEGGALIFAGIVSGSADSANDGRGIFLTDAPGSVTALVREGQLVPDGNTLVGFARPSLNEADEAAFYALFTTDPAAALERENVGLYLKTESGLTEIAREGQSVPSGDGVFDLPRFDLGGTPRLNTRPMLNDSGQVAFLTDLSETVGGGDDEQVLYFFDGMDLVEIARTGTSFLESTIVDLGVAQSFQNDGDEEDGFNDTGQIAFRFALEDDREGVAIWTPDPVVSFRLTITAALDTGYDLEWDSQPGKVYDLVSALDLEIPVSEWQVYQPDNEEDLDRYRDIQARGIVTKLLSVPAEGARRFFAVVEKEAP